MPACLLDQLRQEIAIDVDIFLFQGFIEKSRNNFQISNIYQEDYS
jgi:hypothetical protein